MKSFATKTTINASPEKIWALLTDAPHYTAWNPPVHKVGGQIAPGKKVKVYAKIANGRAFPVKVREFVPHQRMVWGSGMPFGLFKGERTFSLSPRADGQVEFSMREEFTGLMAPMITKSIP